MFQLNPELTDRIGDKDGVEEEIQAKRKGKKWRGRERERDYTGSTLSEARHHRVQHARQTTRQSGNPSSSPREFREEERGSMAERLVSLSWERVTPARTQMWSEDWTDMRLLSVRTQAAIRPPIPKDGLKHTAPAQAIRLYQRIRMRSAL